MNFVVCFRYTSKGLEASKHRHTKIIASLPHGMRQALLCRETQPPRSFVRAEIDLLSQLGNRLSRSNLQQHNTEGLDVAPSKMLDVQVLRRKS